MIRIKWVILETGKDFAFAVTYVINREWIMVYFAIQNDFVSNVYYVVFNGQKEKLF